MRWALSAKPHVNEKERKPFLLKRWEKTNVHDDNVLLLADDGN
jgi:hypothetical protein